MARTAAALALLLQGTAATDFMSTADTLASTASTHLSHASNMIDSGMTKAKAHMEKAKGFAATMQGYLCKVPGLSSMDSCDETLTGTGAAPTKCVGPECCVQSTCMTGFVPGLKCDGARGSTECVGESVFSLSEGMCRCKVGACSPQGRCADSVAGVGALAAPAPAASWETTGAIQRFGMDMAPEAVPKEQIVAPFAMFCCVIGFILFFTFRVGMQVIRSRSTQSSQRNLLTQESAIE